MNDLHVKEQRDHQNLWKTKNALIEDLRQIYVEITGGIVSIVQGNSNIKPTGTKEIEIKYY
jgi:hypothetical protein